MAGLGEMPVTSDFLMNVGVLVRVFTALFESLGLVNKQQTIGHACQRCPILVSLIIWSWLLVALDIYSSTVFSHGHVVSGSRTYGTVDFRHPSSA